MERTEGDDYQQVKQREADMDDTARPGLASLTRSTRFSSYTRISRVVEFQDNLRGQCNLRAQQI